MRTDAFDFEVPEPLIAQQPCPKRDASRLLVAPLRSDLAFSHHIFHELPQLLRPNDCLVFNDTKVFPARLFATQGHRRFECFLLKALDPQWTSWNCLIRAGKKLDLSQPIQFDDAVSASIDRHGGSFQLHFHSRQPIGDWLEKAGRVPLPPYINRDAQQTDKESYQTIYAKHSGSVAAPTAGLHFTKSLFNQLEQMPISLAYVTLHVGYGTFAPIRSETIEDHSMHSETYSVPTKTLDCLARTKANGGRVIAVGTTSLRTLESIETHGREGQTDLFIRPGYRCSIVDGLITNFHLPQSSLFILVSALLGLDRAKKAYECAIAHKYRFYSYGDAMFLDPN